MEVWGTKYLRRTILFRPVGGIPHQPNNYFSQSTKPPFNRIRFVLSPSARMSLQPLPTTQLAIHTSILPFSRHPPPLPFHHAVPHKIPPTPKSRPNPPAPAPCCTPGGIPKRPARGGRPPGRAWLGLRSPVPGPAVPDPVVGSRRLLFPAPPIPIAVFWVPCCWVF